jgi:hypothetical protein
MRTLLTIPRPAIAWAHPNGRQPTIPAMLSAFSAGPGPVHMPKRQLGAIAGLIAFSIQVGNHSPLQIFLSHQSLGPVHETQNIPHRAGDSSGLKVDIALDLMISIPETFRIWRAALPFDEISIGFGGIRLLTLAELKEPQIGYRESLEGNDLCTGAPGDWRSDWVVIGEDTCVGDPLVLDASSKALAVLTAMHGQGQWTLIQSRLRLMDSMRRSTRSCGCRTAARIRWRLNAIRLCKRRETGTVCHRRGESRCRPPILGFAARER